MTGAVAAIMLLIGEGKDNALQGLQNLTILVAAPFVVVMIGMCVALMRDLRRDPQIVRQEFGVEAVESAVIEGHAKYDGDFEIRIGPGTTPVTDERHKHESGDPGSGTASTSTLSKEKAAHRLTPPAARRHSPPEPATAHRSRAPSAYAVRDGGGAERGGAVRTVGNTTRIRSAGPGHGSSRPGPSSRLRPRPPVVEPAPTRRHPTSAAASRAQPHATVTPAPP
ncbi:hypothetical protein SCALM49S_01908 [Streptomyces californicus]